MPKSIKCKLCGKPTRTHKKANFGRSKKGKSQLKPIIVKAPMVKLVNT
jgi:hypothetical protein